MRKILTAVTVLFGVTLATAPARAEIAVGAGVGTLGYGIHVSTEVNSFLALRGNANFGNLGLPNLGLVGSTLGGVDYDIELKMRSYGLLADFHPLGVSPIGDGLVLTGGFYYNQNQVDFTTSASVDIGGGTLSGTILSEMTFDKKFAPYVGFGYDGTFHTVLPISFFATAGVLMQGSPSVNMTLVSGTCGTCDLAAEAQQMENDASNFEYYPVVAFGVSISF